jgi:7-cyano-7-deazaguanine reductase
MNPQDFTEPAVDTSTLRALAVNKATQYEYCQPRFELLERFESPFPKFLADVNKQGAVIQGSVHIEVPEFTSLCPLTGQPDFARIVIDYIPDLFCVESKSLKLYAMSFRQHGDFHESCVARIASDLIRLLEPHQLSVRGEFTPRGGIPFWPEVNYQK